MLSHLVSDELSSNQAPGEKTMVEQSVKSCRNRNSLDVMVASLPTRRKAAADFRRLRLFHLL